MLLYAENFDQIKSIQDLEELWGWGIGSGEISKTDGINDVGECGSQCLQSSTRYYDLPVFKLSRKVVFGIQIGTPANNLKNEADYFEFYFWHNNIILFKIKVTMVNLLADFTFDNIDESLSSPVPENGRAYNRFRKNFFEFYINSTNAENNEGVLKIALNGETIIERTNVYTSNVGAWGGNPANEVSKFNKITMVISSGWIVNTYHKDRFYYHGRDSLPIIIDSLYICNEDGGYHNDFLGPCQITTMYPDNENLGDVNNWKGFPEGEPNASLVDTPEIRATEEDETYIEADTEFLKELYYMTNPLNPVRNMINNPIAVNFRTFVKNMFSYDNQSFDKGLIALTKPSGNPISRETGAKIAVDQYTYKPLDLYYGIVPNLAIPWTWENFEGTQFGVESTQLKHQLFIDEALSIESESNDSI